MNCLKGLIEKCNLKTLNENKNLETQISVIRIIRINIFWKTNEGLRMNMTHNI